MAQVVARPTDLAWLEGFSEGMREAACLAENGAAMARLEAGKLDDLMRVAALMRAADSATKLARAYRTMASQPLRDVSFDDVVTVDDIGRVD